MAKFDPTGTTVTFQSGYLGSIFEISGGGMTREAIPTSTFATTGAHTYIPAALVDLGTFDAQIELDPAVSPQTVMTAAAESVTITWSDTGAATWVADAFATGFTFNGVMGDRATATVTLQWADDMVVTP